MSKKQQPIPKAKKPKATKSAPQQDLLSTLPPLTMPSAPGQRKKVLHVGCGPKTKKDLPKIFQSDSWEEIRLDIDPSMHPDIVADIMDMAPVQNESVEAVFSSHNVEHVYIHQVPQVLEQFYRVIRTGGMVFVTCPDVQAVAFHIAQGRLESALYDSPAGPITAQEILFGHIASLKKGQFYMAHKCSFTAETLGKKLHSAGFREVVVERDKFLNLWARGTKVAQHDPRMQDERISIKGGYQQVVVNVPDIVEGKAWDELDVPPKHWKPLGLKKA